MKLICSCCMFKEFEGEVNDHIYNVFVEGEYLGPHILCPSCAESGEPAPKAIETTEPAQAG